MTSTRLPSDGSVEDESVSPDRGSGRVRSRRERREQFDWQMLAILAVPVAFGAFVWGSIHNLDTMTGMVAAPVLLALAIPLIVVVGRSEKSFDLIGLMIFSFALRLIVSVPRLDSAVDAKVYHQVGVQLADSFRSLQFAVDTGREVPGTGAVRYVSGLVHVATFDDLFAAFLVFTFASFWGVWFFYKAFTIAVPGGDRYRYARLVFLWPSILFWTSSIGKEACMTFTVGLSALGIALLIAKRWTGLLLLAPGLVLTLLIRPHMALVIVVPLLATLLVPRSKGGSTFGVGIRIAGLVVLLLLGAILARTTVEFFNLENLGTSSVESALDMTELQTSQGGSNFSPARVRTPLDYPFAVITVLARPFPTEAHSAESLATSLESLFLIALVVASVGRLSRLPSLMRQYSYVSFTVFYVLVFCFVFAVIGNFGILERQRTQVLPFVFVLLSLPPLDVVRRGRSLPQMFERVGRRGRVRTHV